MSGPAAVEISLWRQEAHPSLLGVLCAGPWRHRAERNLLKAVRADTLRHQANEYLTKPSVLIDGGTSLNEDTPQTCR